MKIQNVDEAIWQERQRQRMSGDFGYSEIGSAVADQIIDEQEESFTDAILNSAKAKWREFTLSLEQTVRDRNEAIAWINSLVPGADRDEMIAKFKAQDSVFWEAYNPLKDLIAEVAPFVGTLPEAKEANFGFAWLAAPALAAFRVIIPHIPKIITAITVFFSVREGFSTITEESKIKYEAMKARPELADKLPPPPSSKFFEQLGSGTKTALLMVAGAAAIFILFKASRKSA